MSIIISHPTSVDVGAVGLQFVGGLAEVESISEDAAVVLRAHGYRVEDKPDLTPKQKLQSEAKELGLSDEGTKDELEARIAAHKTKTAGDGGQTQQLGNDEGKEQS